MKHRHLLGAIVAASFISPAMAGTEATGNIFRWVAMPDAQFYADNRSPDDVENTDPRGTGPIYSDITRWIVAQQGTPNAIHYVQQLGDLTQNGNDPTEWVLAEAAFDLLEGAGIIYGAAEGNHDCAFDFDNCRDDFDGPGTGSYHKNYLTYFGPHSDYADGTMSDQPWYRSSPSGVSNAQLFRFKGRKLGFINLSIGNPQRELDWAKSLIAAEPDRIFIIGSHMLNYDGAFFTGRETEPVTAPSLGLNDPVPFYPRTFEPLPLYIDGTPVNPTAPDLATQLETYTSTGEKGNFGQNVYQELTRQFPNVLLLHSGHNCGENLRTDGINDASNPVVEILTDYQCTLNGGDGWTRVYEFDFDANTLTWYTLSPREGSTGAPGGGLNQDGRPARGSLKTTTDVNGFSRTPMDSFVDYIDFLNGFVAPTAIASFPELIEAQGVAGGVYTQEQFDQFKAADLYEQALEQVVLIGLLGPANSAAFIASLQGGARYPFFLPLHPDFDEATEQAYYTGKLRALLGNPPAPNSPLFPFGWDNIAFFERAWIQFFSEDETGAALAAAAAAGELPAVTLSCNDPATGGFLNKFNRCPAGSITIEFDDYSCPPIYSRTIQRLIDSRLLEGRDDLVDKLRAERSLACKQFIPRFGR